MPTFGFPGVQPAPVSQGRQTLGFKPGPDPQDPPGLFPVASLELGTFASHGDAFPSPKGTATPPNPHSHCCSSGSQQLSHGCTPKAALEFLPGARLPPKMPFLSGMCRTRGAAVPAAALPRHRGLSCPGPRSVSQLLPCSRLPAQRPPILLPVFLTALTAPGSSAACEGQTGCRGSAQAGRQPAAAQGSLHPSLLPNALLFSSPPKKYGFDFQPLLPLPSWTPGDAVSAAWAWRIMELLRLENTTKIESKRQPGPAMFSTKPCP